MRVFPDRRTFTEHFRGTPLGLVWTTFIADALTPVTALLRLGPHPLGRYLLESAEQGERVGRYSFVGAGVRELIAFEDGRGFAYRTHPRDGLVFEHDRWPSTDPLGELRSRLAPWATLPGPLVEDLARASGAAVGGAVPPFWGGAVGFLGYDVVRTIERLPPAPPSPAGGWRAAYLVSDAVVVFDHFRRTAILLALVGRRPGEPPEASHRRGCDRLAELWERLHGPEGVDASRSLAPTLEAPLPALRPAQGPVPDESYLDAVRRARRYIADGDIFQVVLSRELAAPCPEPPLHVYRRLRSINPSPYMFYLEVADPRPHGRPLYLVGASPEVMVRLERGRAVLRPIAGTRPRGSTPVEDSRHEEELRSDPKELAEHMMLVDLGRNDLGRVCRYGTVRVARLLEVERYSHVMHLVSEVEGALSPGLDAFDLMRAAFPAGTVTGAPKIRAMEIIDELERDGRGPYAGAVGYFSVTGDADSCIAIRTLAIRSGLAHARAGAGIVMDSDPERELQESHNKAAALLAALGPLAEGAA